MKPNNPAGRFVAGHFVAGHFVAGPFVAGHFVAGCFVGVVFFLYSWQISNNLKLLSLFSVGTLNCWASSPKTSVLDPDPDPGTHRFGTSHHPLPPKSSMSFPETRKLVRTTSKSKMQRVESRSLKMFLMSLKDTHKMLLIVQLFFII